MPVMAWIARLICPVDHDQHATWRRKDLRKRGITQCGDMQKQTPRLASLATLPSRTHGIGTVGGPKIASPIELPSPGFERRHHAFDRLIEQS